MSQLAWSSYLGGSQDDAIFSISLDDNENVFVTGGTTSTDYPTTANAYNTTFNGGSTDAFVAKIAHNGTFLLTSSFFGSPAYDNAYFVRTDHNDKVYICGQTKCGGTTLVQNAGYYVANSGQFITKFNNDITSVEWSTQFGTNTGKPLYHFKISASTTSSSTTLVNVTGQILFMSSLSYGTATLI